MSLVNQQIRQLTDKYCRAESRRVWLFVVSRRPTLKRGSGETVYKKFGAAGMLEAPIRSLYFKLIM